MADKKCPRCGLWNPETAAQCDCGYSFKLLEMPARSTLDSYSQPSKGLTNRILIVGVVIVSLTLLGYFALVYIGCFGPAGCI